MGECGCVCMCLRAHDVDLLLNRAKWLCIINNLSSESRLSLSLSQESLRDARGGERRRGGRESESACRAGEIVLIKEASAPYESSLVGHRLNRLLQKGTVLVVVVQLQDTRSAIVTKGGMDGGTEIRAEVGTGRGRAEEEEEEHEKDSQESKDSEEEAVQMSPEPRPEVELKDGGGEWGTGGGA